MDLAMKYTGKAFRDLAPEIDALLGNVKPDSTTPTRALTDDEKRKALRSVWQITAPLSEGDLAHKYLTARGVGAKPYPSALRFGAAVKDGEGGVRPCMVAVVSDVEGKPCTLHRTFLRPDGGDKAEMAAPRKLMPGGVPDGAAIRLGEQRPGGPLGIAEGIETALAASAIFEMPVWAAINANILAKWSPPDGVTDVAIFGDHDKKFGGQAAAYQLAHRLAVKGLSVTVNIPQIPGTDWLDDYLSGLRK
jgi:putative DNA primase/helicase